MFSDNPPSPLAYTRAFFSALAIRQGDTVLDVGCGDGFFTRRFLASRAGDVDGIDIEKDAVETARAFNSAVNVAYYEMDATKESFPRDRYDVVIWDGALGHFSSSTTDAMFSKIVNCLTEPGIFCGSESLGKEGGDHLQFFDTAEDLGRILLRHFPIVQVFTCEYPLAAGYKRREAFWRCARSDAALQHLKWQSVTDS